MRPGNERGSKLPPIGGPGAQQNNPDDSFEPQDPKQVKSFLSNYMIEKGVPPEVAIDPSVAAHVATAQNQFKV